MTVDTGHQPPVLVEGDEAIRTADSSTYFQRVFAHWVDWTASNGSYASYRANSCRQFMFLWEHLIIPYKKYVPGFVEHVRRTWGHIPGFEEVVYPEFDRNSEVEHRNYRMLEDWAIETDRLLRDELYDEVRWFTFAQKTWPVFTHRAQEELAGYYPEDGDQLARLLAWLFRQWAEMEDTNYRTVEHFVNGLVEAIHAQDANAEPTKVPDPSWARYQTLDLAFQRYPVGRETRDLWYPALRWWCEQAVNLEYANYVTIDSWSRLLRVRNV